jgi:hypothetical protein
VSPVKYELEFYIPKDDILQIRLRFWLPTFWVSSHISRPPFSRFCLPSIASASLQLRFISSQRVHPKPVLTELTFHVRVLPRLAQNVKFICSPILVTHSPRTLTALSAAREVTSVWSVAPNAPVYMNLLYSLPQSPFRKLNCRNIYIHF